MNSAEDMNEMLDRWRSADITKCCKISLYKMFSVSYDDDEQAYDADGAADAKADFRQRESMCS